MESQALEIMYAAGRKHPCLAESCKCLCVNRIGAGSRLSRCSHEFFSSLHQFLNMFSLNVFEQAIGH